MKTTRHRHLTKLCPVVAFSLGLGLGSASAANIVVNQFAAPVAPGSEVVDTWYTNDVRPGGTATIQDLTGFGGNLELSQPLGSGAARLTTDGTNAAKAQVGTYNDFGLASSVLASINLGYSYFKTASTELDAAPSIKLSIFNASGTGTGDLDSFGTLVYEPTWNLGVNGSAHVPSGAWQTVSIDQNTGAGLTGGGGWWWDGGFGVGNGAGGPPIKSLAEWLTAFQTGADAADFAGAHVNILSVGVGTYNINQDDYFDKVSISTGAISKTYDFQAPSPPASVPDGGWTIELLGCAMVGLAALRRKLR
jgi:hypothetical protein